MEEGADMRWFTWFTAGAAALCSASCGLRLQAPAAEPQVEIIGGQPSALTPQPATATQPYEGTGPVARDSLGVDRSTWPRQRLQVGRPAMPRLLAPLENRLECATGPEPKRSPRLVDVPVTAWAFNKFCLDTLLYPVVGWLKRPAPVPLAEPSPYGADGPR
jgi:hypothetical protein